MILWVVLFFIVVGLSLVLAIQSMKDYQEIPLNSKELYSLFLIRQPQNLNEKFFNDIGKMMQADNLIISIERLFKGKQSAIAIYGPKKILASFNNDLSLLELEDYSLDLNSKDTVTWEMGTRSKDLNLDGTIFKNLPSLLDNEQFCWQVVLGIKGSRNLSFQTQIRAAYFGQDAIRKGELLPQLQNLTEQLVKISRPFSSEQIIDFYRLRSLGKDSAGPVLTSNKVGDLIKI